MLNKEGSIQNEITDKHGNTYSIEFVVPKDIQKTIEHCAVLEVGKPCIVDFKVTVVKISEFKEEPEKKETSDDFIIDSEATDENPQIIIEEVTIIIPIEKG